MTRNIKTFLMFEGRCEEAVNFDVSLFPGAAITGIRHYGAGELWNPGQTFMCVDSPVKHGFTLMPAISLFVDCGSEAEIDHLFAKLVDGGQVFMPLNADPFSPKFGWLSDRFGVSWQLNLVNG